ncbi:hypothetical protein MGYG_05361 [Nannizzia gypsea CBS 118893]|uniref:Uncharacterized protein n=1 Tax=Arthroderma gypseum (strain ATCC MYA-4604 / CBS 118893) TaxID=535722 RepID=E4UVN8_ARTGP|nr:hypothetical protein MGYG_05361 [Nannizzia gypsea CBS 118893]EFR02365.1 hypothetical protein MGYG_05361 [Nannizzia gypsea CBS 118893]
MEAFVPIHLLGLCELKLKQPTSASQLEESTARMKIPAYTLRSVPRFLGLSKYSITTRDHTVATSINDTHATIPTLFSLTPRSGGQITRSGNGSTPAAAAPPAPIVTPRRRLVDPDLLLNGQGPTGRRTKRSR